MKYLSLFSGIGGLELGIQQAYVETNQKKKKRIRETDSEAIRSGGDRREDEEYQGSDTQRYKTLGNAVTVNVIKDIMIKLIPSGV